MPFPKTEEEREAAGYKFMNASECRGCRAPIEWWETPNGKRIPLDLDGEPHWSTCPKADEFRTRKRE